MPVFKSLLAAIVMLFASATVAASETLITPEAQSRVMDESPVTYLDLARHFVPDIAASGGAFAGTVLIPMRHIGDAGPPEPFLGIPGFSSLSALPINRAGRRQLLVMFDFAQYERAPDGAAVLALYDLAKEPILLDAVNVGFDSSNGFAEQPFFDVGAGTSVVLTTSTHSNAGQAYRINGMIMLRQDHFSLIDTMLLFNDLACNLDRRQEAKIIADNPGASIPSPLHVTVTEIAKPGDDGCEDGTPQTYGTRTFQTNYIWDADRTAYRADNKQLEALGLQNQNRF